VRDIIETHFLVDYLVTYPAKIDEWRRADEKERKGRFGPNAIRNALDKRDGFRTRKEIYNLISQLGYSANDDWPELQWGDWTVLRRTKA
jgi:hypothetical protein